MLYQQHRKTATGVGRGANKVLDHGGLNFIRAIGHNNPKRKQYWEAAVAYMQKHEGGMPPSIKPGWSR